MKVTLSDIKIYREPTVKWRKLGFNDLEHKEEISIQPEEQEEPRIQQNKDSIRSLWNAPNVPTFKS